MTIIDFRMRANKFIRESVPYQPGKSIEVIERELGMTPAIKLASNENPLGASPLAILAATYAIEKNVHIYPDNSYLQLRQALATTHAITPDHITLGNGSENILDLIIKSYLPPTANAIVSQYTFLTIPNLIKIYGARYHTIPTKNWYHDIIGTVQAIDDDTAMIFLVNPSNPTGTYIHEKDFCWLMETVPAHVLVVVDEAYIEYITVTDFPKTINYLTQYPNLIITRTFSKLYGLASLRIGYAISSPDIADILNRARLPFNVNGIALKAAYAALQDKNHIEKSLRNNQQGMQDIIQALEKWRMDYIPSVGNFITIKVRDAMTVYQQLLFEGVIVRPLQIYDLPNYIRVTIGTPEQNQHFLTALEKVMGQ